MSGVTGRGLDVLRLRWDRTSASRNLISGIPLLIVRVYLSTGGRKVVPKGSSLAALFGTALARASASNKKPPLAERR